MPKVRKISPLGGKSETKQRLFGYLHAGKVGFLIGSSETMGTGVS